MNFNPQIIKKQTEMEYSLLAEIMTKVLKREPTTKDRLQFEIITHPRYDDRYLFAHNGAILGMVKRSFENTTKLAGCEFKVNFNPEVKTFY